MKNQKEATFEAISQFGEVSGSPVKLSKTQRSEVVSTLIGGFRAGEIELSTPAILGDEAKLKTYVNGLVSNWLRKDSRLNGGVKYVPANPGSRVSDVQLREMKKLRATLTNADDIQSVDFAIAERQAALAKAKAPTIDFSMLPASLSHFNTSEEA